MAKKDKEKGSKDKQKGKKDETEKKPKDKAPKEDANLEKVSAKEKVNTEKPDNEKPTKKDKKSKEKDGTDPDKVEKKEKKHKSKDKEKDHEAKTVKGHKKDSLKKDKTNPLDPLEEEEEDEDLEAFPESQDNENESFKGETTSGTTGGGSSEPSGDTNSDEMDKSIKPAKEKFVPTIYESLIKEIPTECLTLETMFDCLVQQIVSDSKQKDSVPSGAKIYGGIAAAPSSKVHVERKPKFALPKLVKGKDYATSRVCHLQEHLAIRLSATEIRGNLLGIQNFLWNSIDQKHCRGMHLKSLANLYQFMQFIPTIKPDDLYYILHSLIVEGIGNYLQNVGENNSANVSGRQSLSVRQSFSNASIRHPREVEELESFMVIPNSLAEKIEYIPGTQLLSTHNYFAIDRKNKTKYLFIPERDGKLDVTTLGVREQTDVPYILNVEREFSGYEGDVETVRTSGLFRFREIPGEAGEAEFIWEEGDEMVPTGHENIERQSIDTTIPPGSPDATRKISQLLMKSEKSGDENYPTPPNTARDQEKQCGQGDFNPFVLQEESYERFVPCDNWSNSGINDPRIMQKLLDCSILSSIHTNNGRVDLSSWAQNYLLCNGLCTPTDKNIIGPISEFSYIEEYSPHQMIQVLGEYIRNNLSFSRFYNPFYDTLIFIFSNPNPSTLTAEESYITSVNLSPEIQNFLEEAMVDNDLDELLLGLKENNDNEEGLKAIDLVTLMQLVPENKWAEIPSIRVVLENGSPEGLNKLLELVYSHQEEEEEEENNEDEEDETVENEAEENAEKASDEEAEPVLSPTKDVKHKRKKSTEKDKTKGLKDKRQNHKGKKKSQVKDTNIVEEQTATSSIATSTSKKKKKGRIINRTKSAKSKHSTESKEFKKLTQDLEFQCYDLGKQNLTHAADVFYLFPENGPILTYEIEAIEPDYLMLQLKLSLAKNSCVFYPYYVPTDMDLALESYVVVPYFHFTLNKEIIIAFSDLRVMDSSPRRKLVMQHVCTEEFTNLPTDLGTFTMEQIVFISDKWKEKCRSKIKGEGWKKSTKVISKVTGLRSYIKKKKIERQKIRESFFGTEEQQLLEEMLGEVETEILGEIDSQEEDEEMQFDEENEGELEITPHDETQLEHPKKLKTGRKSKDDGTKTKKEKSKDKKNKKTKEKENEQEETKEKKGKKKDKKNKSSDDADAKGKVSNKKEEAGKTKKTKNKHKKGVADKKTKDEQSDEKKDSIIEDHRLIDSGDKDAEEDEEQHEAVMKELGVTEATAVPSTPILGFTFTWKDAAVLLQPLVHTVGVTLPSGLNIKVEDDIGPPLARVIRQSHSTGSSVKTNESSRYYLSNGMVISFMMNKSIHIINSRGVKTIINQLFANIVRDETTIPTIFQLLSDKNTDMKVHQGEVVLTNGEHYKFIRGKRYLVQPLPIYTSCPLPTGEKFRRRQDGVIFTYLTNGVVITHYPDGTRFTSSVLLQADNQPTDEEFADWIFVGIDYLIEHPNYSSVKFNTLTGDASVQFTEDSSLSIYSDGAMQVVSSSDNYKVNINQYLAVVTSQSTITDSKSQTFSAIKLFHSPEFLIGHEWDFVFNEDLGESEEDATAAETEEQDMKTANLEANNRNKNKKKAKKKNAPKPKKISNKKLKVQTTETESVLNVMEQDLRKRSELSEDALKKYSGLFDENGRRKTLTLEIFNEMPLNKPLADPVKSKNIPADHELEEEEEEEELLPEIRHSKVESSKRESLQHFLTFTDMWTFCKVSDTVDNRFAMDIYGQIVVNKSIRTQSVQNINKSSTPIGNENTKIVVVKRDFSGFEFLRRNYVNKVVANSRNSNDGTVMTIDPLPQGRRLINLMEPLLRCPTKGLSYKEPSIRPEMLTNKHIKLTLNQSDLNWFGYIIMNPDITEPSLKEQEKYGTFKGQCDGSKFDTPDSWRKLEKNVHPSTKIFEVTDMGKQIARPAKSQVQLHYEGQMSEFNANPVHPQSHKNIDEKITTILTRKIIEIPKVDESLLQLLSSASQSYSKTVENYNNIYANYEVLDPRSNHEKENARLVKQRFFEQNLDSMHLFEQESGKAMLQFHF